MTSYRAAAPTDLVVVPLDDLTAFHHRPAGATHLLAEPAPQIIAALQEGPANADELIARLSTRFALDDDSAAALTARLEELVAAGLVATA